MPSTKRPTPPLSRIFSDRGFRGPVLTLISGSVIALVAAYLAQPILTRLYSPESFGIADYFVGVLTILVTAASLRYEDAIMSPEDENDAAAIIWLTIFLSVGFAVLTAISIPFSESIAVWIRVPGMAPFIPLIPLTLLLMRLTRLGELWLARHSRFRSITTGDVANKLSMVGVRLGAGFSTAASASGLIGGFIAGHAVSSAAYSRIIIKEGLVPALPSRRHLGVIAKRFRRFPLFTLPSATMAAAVARLPILLLPLYYPIETVGLYGRAFLVLAIPLGLIGNSVSQVFFVKAAEARSEGTLPTLTEIVHSRLVMIGIFPTLILIVAGPDLFEFVLGDTWREAGRYVQYLAVWLFLGSVSAPLTRLFDVMERQRSDFLTSLLMFVVLTAALIVSGSRGQSIETTLIAVGIAGVVVRLVQLGTATLGTGASPGGLVAPYIRYGLYSVPGMVLTYFVLSQASPLLSTIAAAVGGLIYAVLTAWDEGFLRRTKAAD